MAGLAHLRPIILLFCSARLSPLHPHRRPGAPEGDHPEVEDAFSPSSCKYSFGDHYNVNDDDDDGAPERDHPEVEDAFSPRSCKSAFDRW